MSVLFSDLKIQIQDFLANYSTTTVDTGALNRGANRAIEFVQRRLGLPSDKKVSSFYFYEDTTFYSCPTDFNEILAVRYNTTAAATSVIGQDPNNNRSRWILFKDVEILQSSGIYPDFNQVGFTTMNGSNQLVMHGRNQRPSYTINAFNSSVGFTNSSDIVSVTQDTNIYKYSNASVKFNINTGLSASYFSITGLWDIRTALNNGAAYRLYVDFPSGTTGYFSNVEIRLQSSSGNYYTMNTTVQSDGTAWNSGTWSLLSWSLSNATTVGSPDPSQISTIYIYFNHSGSFTTTTGMRINYFYQIFPDYMDLIYFSQYKGTDTTGTTKKIVLDTDSDICSFGAYVPDLILPIALKASTYLSPQLLADPNFRNVYKEDFTEAMLVFGRIYPRSRASGDFGATYLRRV